MNTDRAQLKQLMYGMNRRLDVSTDKPQAKSGYPDTPAIGIDGEKIRLDEQDKLLNLELPDSMKFFIIS